MQSVKNPCLDALKNLAIGALNLAITHRMRYRSITDLNSKVFTEIFENSTSELSAIIGDNTIRYAKSMHYVDEKIMGSVGCNCNHWPGFNPLGKLVYRQKEMSKTTWRLFERANHIQFPNSKGP